MTQGTTRKRIRSVLLWVLDAVEWFCSNSFIRLVIWVFAVLCGPLILLFFSLEVSSLSIDRIEGSYQRFGRSFIDLFGSKDVTLGTGSLPYIFTTVVGVIFGVLVTIVAVFLTVRSTRSENRKQATIKILLEARISKDFQSNLTLIQDHFPSGKKASPAKFKAYSRSNQAIELRAATALLQMLNYYEFIGTGVKKGNLDSVMTKETIRGPLCRLVFDMRDIIRDYRITKKQQKTFQDIVALYWLWVDENQNSEFDDKWAKGDLCLGAPPPYSRMLARCRSKLLMW